WTRVARAKPLFDEHYQPHLPERLGFYDLRLAATRTAQAELARQFGIDAFCYYHYWFAGRRLLERPLAEVIASGQPDFPFCVGWANESWTRRWDGGNQRVLLPQIHSEELDRAFLEDMLPILGDERYLRVDGKPLLLVYRPHDLPEPLTTVSRWREVARA